MKRKIVSFLLLFSVIVSLFSCAKQAEVPFSIDILSVGKADCIVIRTTSNTVMIDTGEAEKFPEIKAYLEANGIRTIDLLILSHFDKDHIGGAEQILQTCEVKKVLESSFSSDRSEYLAYHKIAEEQKVTVEKLTENASVQFGKIALTVMTPKEKEYSRKEDNNASLVVSLQYGEKSFLFCGDALEERMKEILSEELGEFDLIKLPHHGSYLKNYDEILAAFPCKYAVITDSSKNPADEKLLKLLSDEKIEAYETRYGTIRITYDEKDLLIQQK